MVLAFLRVSSAYCLSAARLTPLSASLLFLQTICLLPLHRCLVIGLTLSSEQNNLNIMDLKDTNPTHTCQELLQYLDSSTISYKKLWRPLIYPPKATISVQVPMHAREHDCR